MIDYILYVSEQVEIGHPDVGLKIVILKRSLVGFKSAIQTSFCPPLELWPHKSFCILRWVHFQFIKPFYFSLRCIFLTEPLANYFQRVCTVADSLKILIQTKREFCFHICSSSRFIARSHWRNRVAYKKFQI